MYVCGTNLLAGNPSHLNSAKVGRPAGTISSQEASNLYGYMLNLFLCPLNFTSTQEARKAFDLLGRKANLKVRGGKSECRNFIETLISRIAVSSEEDQQAEEELLKQGLEMGARLLTTPYAGASAFKRLADNCGTIGQYDVERPTRIAELLFKHRKTTNQSDAISLATEKAYEYDKSSGRLSLSITEFMAITQKKLACQKLIGFMVQAQKSMTPPADSPML